MAFDQDLTKVTCLIFPLRWAHLPMKNSRKAQSVHLFPMNFNGFRSSCLYFTLKCPFPMIKSSHSGNTIYMRLFSMKASTKIELFYFDDNFHRIAQWVLALTHCAMWQLSMAFEGLKNVKYVNFIKISIIEIRVQRCITQISIPKLYFLGSLIN